MRHIFKLIPAFVVLLCSPSVWSYPDFIGYGYSSCITCHYSGLGGGALNDYGRALFATEITARDTYPKNMEEEEIAAQSGFAGSKQLPWWVRPGLKYRGLYFQQNPNAKNQIDMWYNMQQDVNLNFFFDKKQSIALITTTSYADKNPPYAYIDQWGWYEKEIYVRGKFNNNFWLYVGQMDKAYGIRNVDHSAVNRKAITLGQFDQSLGVMAHFTYPDWDIAVNPFFGNIYDKDENKQKGVAVTGEYQVFEKFKVGGSFLTSQSDATKWQLAAVTTRMGLSKGSSLMGEFGLKEKTNKTTGADPVLGSYAWVESLISIRRGYNLLSALEHSKDDISKGSAEVLKWSVGALMFPLPRTELRVGLTNSKTSTDGSGVPDAWTFQSQVHFSY